VTKGLITDAPTKDSGVEWLGEVPAHWEVTSLRRCATSIRTGGTPPDAYRADDEIDGGALNWYTPGDFGDSLLLPSASARLISKEAIVAGEGRLFPAGSVLIVGIGATLGKVGYTKSDCSANQQINAVV